MRMNSHVSIYLLLVLILIGVAQVLTKTPPPEVTKESTRPLPSSASSTSSRTSVDEGGSESGSPASLSTKQLVYIAADIQKLQEKVQTQTQTKYMYLHWQFLFTYIYVILDFRVNLLYFTSVSIPPFWEFLPLNCFHTDGLFLFLVDTRVVRDGQTAVGGHRIQKLCDCGR